MGISNYVVLPLSIGALGIATVAAVNPYAPSKEPLMERAVAIQLTRSAFYPSIGYYVFGEQIGPENHPTAGYGYALQCKDNRPVNEMITLWSDTWEGLGDYQRVSLQSNGLLKGDSIEVHYFDLAGKKITPFNALDVNVTVEQLRSKFTSNLEEGHPAKACIDTLLKQ